MPKKVERCVRSLKRQGHTEDEAWAICKASQDNRTSSENETETPEDDE